MKIPSPLLRTLSRFGLDRAVGLSFLSRAWLALSGLVTMGMLTHFLSPDEQGFYFSFTSVVSLQIFFELGLTYVVLQFASHEKAKLEWTPQGTVTGDDEAKARLASLLRLGVKWFCVVTLLVILVILPLGLWFFAAHQPAHALANWRWPWVWLVLISAVSLLLAPPFAILQGCGLVAEIAQMRLIQAVVGTLVFWLVLLLGGKLMSSFTISAITLAISLAWLGWKRRAFFLDLWALDPRLSPVSWRQEVWPLQWRIAVSWISGYLIFQLFNPAALAFSGAAEAGKMGLSIVGVGAVSSVASVWMETKIAPFGSLIAAEKWQELDAVFFAALWRSLFVIVGGGVLLWIFVFALHHLHYPIAGRFLPPFPLALIIGASIVNHIVGAEAIYLRAFKREPFLGLSVISAILMLLSIYFLGRNFGVNGMMIGYFIISCIGLGGGTWIFRQKRRLWQNENKATPGEPPVKAVPAT